MMTMMDGDGVASTKTDTDRKCLKDEQALASMKHLIADLQEVVAFVDKEEKQVSLC